jgi:hypothetical protein
MDARFDRIALGMLGAALALAAGCAAQRGPAAAPAATTQAPAAGGTAPAGPGERTVKSRDGRFDGVVVGTPAANSKFAKVQIGMEMQEVQQLIGAPDLWHSHETGKRWIPFYFGNDTRRLQATWKNEGCLSFTGGNAWGGGGNELVRIEADPSGKCYQP